MGNDGGSIPKRRELVKAAARAKTVGELKATAHEALEHAWTHDALTGDPLPASATVAADWRGRLYNYETVLTALLPGGAGDSSSAAELLPLLGIASLRDVVRLRFKNYTSEGGAGGGRNLATAWACPVTLKELGPATRAVYLVRCGHVFAEAAMRKIHEAGDDKACPECSEAFSPDEDVVPILPTEEAELERLAARLEGLKARGLTHSLKKDKSAGKERRQKKRKGDEARGDADAGKEEGPAGKKVKEANGKDDVSSRVSGINNPATASLTARVLAEEEARNKRKLMAAR
ncbi:hypothetical protein P8C59_008981 [Phyllachora maydis]|uniref:Replication termination factor 2 n=1 Tax=Phyllachora maydis TaxID=1825666 RepID=A0AAD9IC68_9PEZI|nr:hypothetical protein P8C59_008981 [Phyllachora maydis]